MLTEMKSLSTGDTVAILAPTGLENPAQAELAAQTASELHLVPILYPSCKKRPVYASFDDSARADELNHAFFDASIRAIWAIGCSNNVFRLVRKLRFRTSAMHPKPLFAPPEGSALHLAYNQLAGLPTYLAPDLGTTELEKMSLHTQALMKSALFGAPWPEQLTEEAAPLTTMAKGVCAGPLAAGTLESLCATLGTPYAADMKDRIVVLDSDEADPAKVDAMFVHLKHAGVFEQCAGVLLGTFRNCSSQAVQIVRDLLLDEGKPVLFGISFPTVLPMGQTVRMDATAGAVFLPASKAKM